MTDAAAVSGPLWISYLLALFYFLVAAGAVTHKSLFLEQPVKLPFLGIDLPLIGFFWLAPIVFSYYTPTPCCILSSSQARSARLMRSCAGRSPTGSSGAVCAANCRPICLCNC
jgi:hypothetical protein